MQKNLLIQNLCAVVTCDGANNVFTDCDMLIRDGIIAKIGKGIEAPEGCEVLSGAHMLCYPGLVNTHHHLYQCFSRNLPDVQNMELFDWLRALYEVWKNLDKNVVRYSALTALGLSPIVGWYFGGPLVAGLCLFIAALVYVRHAANIRRLLKGEEPKISFSKKKAA